MTTPDQPTAQPDKKRIFLLLALYFTVHLLLRVLVSDSAELDEAEQLLLTQDLRMGYGSQPPVYTWLLIGLFSLFGTNIFALTILKNCLLFLTYFFVYLSAQVLTRNDNRAVIAMLSLFLIPQIFWESQRDLTHSVLGTTVAACTLFVMLQLLKTGRLHYYALFGLCAGVGVVSKYNYAVFLVALFLAACSLKNLRPQVLNRKMLLGVLCLLLVTSPHAFWAVNNLQSTLSQAGKFQMGHDLGLFVSYLLGLKTLLVAVISFLGLLLPAYAAFFYQRRRGKSGAAEISDYAALIRRTLLTGLLLCILMIVLFKVTVFKDRWMQPLLFATPLYLVTLPWGRFTSINTRRYAGFAMFIALAVLLLMPGHILWAAHRAKLSRLNSPYAAFAAQLRQAGFGGGLIVAQGRLVGGNLKLFFPASVVVAPEVPLFAAPIGTDLLVVWDATKGAEIPGGLAAFADTVSLTRVSGLQAQYIDAPYKYAADRSMRLGFLLLHVPELELGN